MIDSRFLNLETRIDGILEGDDNYCQITTSRIANGKRYLVLGTDTEYEYHNCIVSNNNGTLSAVPARKGMPPVIDNRGNILSYNGTSWEGIGHVGAILVEDIVDFVCVNAESSDVQNKFSNKTGVKFLVTHYVYEESAAILISTGNGVTCVMPEKTIFYDNCANNVNGGFWYLANNEDGKVYYTMPFSTSSTDGAVPIPIEVGAGAVVIHKDTGKAYTYDSTAHKWTPVSGISVKYVDDIIDCDYTSSEQDETIAVAGTKFISTNNYNYYNEKYIYTADGNGSADSSPDMSNSNEYEGYRVVDASGNLYVFGRCYNCPSPGTVDSGCTYWVKYGQVPASERKNTLFISKADYSMYQVDVSSGNLVKIGESAAGITNEVFTLTSTNISNKSITLSSSVASGKTGSVLVFLGGAVHTAGTDFSVSGSTISWNGLALDTAGLKQGDKIVVQYVPAE